MDDAICFVTFYLFEGLEFLILDYKLYLKSAEWLQLDRYQPEGDAMPLVFAAFIRSVTNLLLIVDLGTPGRVIVEFEKDGSPI